MGEWNRAKFLEAPVRIIDGDRGVNYPKKTEFLPEGYCLFLNAGNVTFTGFDFSDCSFISLDRDKALGKGKLERNDSVLTTRGTVGNVAFFDNSVPFDLIRINSGMVIFRPEEDHLLPSFLYQFLRSSLFGDQVKALTTGSAQPQLPIRDINRIEIPLPPLPEQRAIAAVLSALDDKIALNRRMNETLERQARALFKDWFVHFGPTRAKASGAKPYLPPEIWSLFPDRLDENGVPEEWVSQSVIDQAEWINGAAYKNMHFNKEPDALPVIKIAELKAGVTQKTKWTDTALGDKYKITTGELLFSWSGNPDTSIDAFIWTGGDAWLNQHIFAVRSNGMRSPAFLYTMLKGLMPEFSEIARNKQTTGLGHVTKQDLKRMKIHMGSNDIIDEFEKLVGPIYARLQSNLIESRTLAQTRDLLLPKLMSGALRVGAAEKIVEGAL